MLKIYKLFFFGIFVKIYILNFILYRASLIERLKEKK